MFESATVGVLFSSSSLFPPKSQPRMTVQVADHLVPNQVLGFFEFFRERERGKYFCFQRLTKAFIGADSRNLKMRRLPPTVNRLSALSNFWYSFPKLLISSFSFAK